jgi:hypothetical protein
MDANPSGDFYAPLTDELCQGDIYGCIPLVRLRSIPQVMKLTTISPTLSAYQPNTQFDPTLAPTKDRQKRQVLTECDFTAAVLLTHGCEIDKGVKDLSLAILRPFDATVGQEAAVGIRANKKIASFYLPPAQGWAECYVDFRRIVTVGPNVLRTGERVRRLSDQSRDAMLFHFFRFFTRREIKSTDTTVVDE